MKMLLFFFCTLPFCCMAQKDKVVLRYFNQDLELTSKKDFTFIGASVKTENGWYVYALYPDTSTLLKAYYKDKSLRIKEGPYRIYYPKEAMAQQGYYKNNLKTGIWRSWYENGQLKDSGAYDNDRKVGQWRSWHSNGKVQMETEFKKELSGMEAKVLGTLLKNELQQTKGIKHGVFNSWYENGIAEAKGTYKNNVPEGQWQWFHSTGAISTTEVYTNGKISALTCYDSTGKETDDFCPIEKPAVLKIHGDYKSFLQQNLRWPEEAIRNNMEGMVSVQFTVTKEGKLENLMIASKFPVLSKAVEEVFAQMQDWYPAVSHNRVLESKEEYMIPFYFTE